MFRAEGCSRRILFSGTPAHDHLLPPLPLERAARQAGHTTALLTHASLGDLVAPAPVHGAGATLEEALGQFRWRTGKNAATDMSPATAGEFFGGTRIDLGADDALTAARDFAPDLVLAETADFPGSLAASRLGVEWASHGVGIALAPSLAEAVWTAAAARAAERGIVLARPSVAAIPGPTASSATTGNRRRAASPSGPRRTEPSPEPTGGLRPSRDVSTCPGSS